MRFTVALAKRGSALIKKGSALAKETWFIPKPKLGELTKKYANLPEEYLKKSLSREYWRTPRGINYLPRVYESGRAIIGLERPWTMTGKRESDELEAEVPPYVEPLREWFFFKGDRVEILEGKDKGKQGIINYIVQERNWVIVKGLNTEVVERELDSGYKVYTLEERPLLVTTQVALVDPGDLQPTKAEWAYTEEGDKVRVSTRSGRIIPFSVMKDETYDYKVKAAYKEGPKDTHPDDAGKVTFTPALKTFEMDIADEFGIKEDRVPTKSYWY